MKKVSLLFLFSLITAVMSAAVYRVDIDDVSRVDVFIDLNTPLEGLKNGMNDIDMGSERYLRVQAKAGVMITEATKIDDYDNSETSIPLLYEDGKPYVDFDASFPEDEWLRIRTSAASDARSASCMVKVDNPAKVKLTRKSSDEAIELISGENTVKFDPNTENELVITPVSKALYSVKKNGEPITADYRYTIPVAQDDYIEIQAEYPDKDCRVKFNLSGNGAEDFITEVDVDGRPEFGWKADNFTIKAGAELSLKGNTTEFEVLSFSVNGASEIFTNPTKILITNDTEISVSVRKYTSFTMTVNIDDPAKAHVYRGYSYNNNEIILNKGNNTIEITRNTPIISVVPADGCYINTLSISEYDYTIEELQRAPILVGSLTDDDVLTITTGTIVRDKKAMVYVENIAAAEGYFKALRADMSEISDIKDGYNEILFYDRDNSFRFETGGPATAHVFVNETSIEPAPGGFTYTPDLNDGDVVKIFFGQAPQKHSVTLTVDNEIADKVSIFRDHICDVSLLASHTALNNSLYTVSATDDAVKVAVNGENIAPATDGQYTFVVTSPTAIEVKAASSGIESIVTDSGKSKIFNLQGLEIDRPFEELPAGIYIVNGHKVAK